MSEAAKQFRAAVKAALTADNAIANTVSGVFDRTPDNAPSPSIRMGEAQTRSETLSAMRIDSVALALELESKAHERDEIETLAARVVSLFDGNHALNVSGHNLARLAVSRGDIEIDRTHTRYTSELTLNAVLTESA